MSPSEVALSERSASVLVPGSSVSCWRNASFRPRRRQYSASSTLQEAFTIMLMPKVVERSALDNRCTQAVLRHATGICSVLWALRAQRGDNGALQGAIAVSQTIKATAD